MTSLFCGVGGQVRYVVLGVDLCMVVLLFSFRVDTTVADGRDRTISPLLVSIGSSLAVRVFLGVPRRQGRHGETCFLWCMLSFVLSPW